MGGKRTMGDKRGGDAKWQGRTDNLVRQDLREKEEKAEWGRYGRSVKNLT